MYDNKSITKLIEYVPNEMTAILSYDIFTLIAGQIVEVRDLLRMASASKMIRRAVLSTVTRLTSIKPLRMEILRLFPKATRLDWATIICEKYEAVSVAASLHKAGLTGTPIAIPETLPWPLFRRGWFLETVHEFALSQRYDLDVLPFPGNRRSDDDILLIEKLMDEEYGQA